ncbi:MAG: hypothetical protein ACTSYO_03325 [Candidatus Ranarchaeia archaeon]
MQSDVLQNIPYSYGQRGARNDNDQSLTQTGKNIIPETLVYNKSNIVQSYGVIQKTANYFEVRILPHINSKEDLITYKQMLTDELTELARGSTIQVPIVITFDRLISKNEYRNYIQKYGITVELFETKLTTASSDTWVIGGSPSETDLFPEDLYESMVSDIRDALNGEEISFEGIYSVRGTIEINEQKYSELANDEMTLLADISPLIVKHEVIAAGYVGVIDPDLLNLYWISDELTIFKGD